MRKALSKIDKIIILCRNVDKTSSIYSETLGMRVFIQSPDFVELRDSNNLPVYLQQSRNASHLSKGYSPILSFHVVHSLGRSKTSKKCIASCWGMNWFLMGKR